MAIPWRAESAAGALVGCWQVEEGGKRGVGMHLARHGDLRYRHDPGQEVRLAGGQVDCGDNRVGGAEIDADEEAGRRHAPASRRGERTFSSSFQRSESVRRTAVQPRFSDAAQRRTGTTVCSRPPGRAPPRAGLVPRLSPQSLDQLLIGRPSAPLTTGTGTRRLSHHEPEPRPGTGACPPSMPKGTRDAFSGAGGPAPRASRSRCRCSRSAPARMRIFVRAAPACSAALAPRPGRGFQRRALGLGERRKPPASSQPLTIETSCCRSGTAFITPPLNRILRARHPARAAAHQAGARRVPYWLVEEPGGG